MRNQKIHANHIDPIGFIYRAASPWNLLPKTAGGYMKCYMLDSTAMLFPSIPVSLKPCEHFPPTWLIELGGLGRECTQQLIPVPWNTHISVNPTNENYGSVREVPLATGRFMVYIRDQSTGPGSMIMQVKHQSQVLASAQVGHGDDYPDAHGYEYLMQLLPFDEVLCIAEVGNARQKTYTKLSAGQQSLSVQFSLEADYETINGNDVIIARNGRVA